MYPNTQIRERRMMQVGQFAIPEKDTYTYDDYANLPEGAP